ncbi:tyrosine-type recombinase/integrase [Ketogulonicigenium vulgare]|uniref:tyrosine-type recombinase/integrase n=1 Tax=Ketogulonicigenium vulgare TaxID=92945 RepID=UPI00235A2FBB|nr:site-specific integrase [Ketogulonicigenium vulgare]
MRVNFPGLLIEKHRNGSVRYRVRVEGNKAKRIAIPVGPDHPEFGNYYWSARSGEGWTPTAAPKVIVHSLDWLAHSYLQHVAKSVDAGAMSDKTLRQRRSLLNRLCDHVDADGRYGDLDMNAPAAAFVRVRDAWIATPAAADNLMKACRMMYQWGIENGHVKANPASGVSAIHKSKGGAKAWTLDELRRFKAAHPKGTTAHLWLSLHMFTACRISDVIWLGRDCEITRDGQIWLEWTPRKKGSAPVTLPILPPLYEATRAAKVVGQSYLLTNFGKSFSTPEGLRNRVRKWCETAGIKGKTSHGLRKAVAELLAEAGCTQHQIMAIMAHTQAKTSEIYTRGAQRRTLSSDAMKALMDVEW